MDELLIALGKRAIQMDYFSEVGEWYEPTEPLNKEYRIEKRSLYGELAELSNEAINKALKRKTIDITYVNREKEEKIINNLLKLKKIPKMRHEEKEVLKIFIDHLKAAVKGESKYDPNGDTILNTVLNVFADDLYDEIFFNPKSKDIVYERAVLNAQIKEFKDEGLDKKAANSIITGYLMDKVEIEVESNFYFDIYEIYNLSKFEAEIIFNILVGEDLTRCYFLKEMKKEIKVLKGKVTDDIKPRDIMKLIDILANKYINEIYG